MCEKGGNATLYRLRATIQSMAFIVIEGGEGVGKTTQIKLLKERLPAAFPEQEFVFTKEPNGTPFGAKIGALILADEAKEASGSTMFGLFIAARFDHVEKVVAPALKSGKTILCDRFVAATYAYQIVAHGCTELLPMYREHLTLLQSTLPDIAIVLDLDPSIALERLAKRHDQVKTHYDARELSFHQKLREGYHEYAKLFASTKTVFVDASQEIETVYQDILKAITAALG